MNAWTWKRWGAAAVALVLTFGIKTALAATAPPAAGEVVPRQIPYRGYLDQNGVPVTNTSVPMVFELFTSETAGRAEWSEGHNVSVVDGQFTVALGDDAAIPARLFAQPSLYLQITVDGQQLAGRQRLLTVPYAQHAAAAGFPPGTVVAFAGSTPPPGWLICDGRAVPRSEYPELFEAIGAAYGAGDGASTFQLPDLRGRFVRGADAGTGRDRGPRGAGLAQDWATALPRAGFATNAIDLSHAHSYADWYFAGDSSSANAIPPQGPNTSHGISGAMDRDNNRFEETRTSGGSTQNLSHSHAVTGGDAETRPANVAMNWIIRALP